MLITFRELLEENDDLEIKIKGVWVKLADLDDDILDQEAIELQVVGDRLIPVA